MKNPPQRPARAGFTLIELLVVISIIAILASLAIPATQGVMVNAKKAQARNDIAQITNAIKMYYTEYSRYPVDNTNVSTDDSAVYGFGRGNDNIISILRNKSSQNVSTDTLSTLNPRQIKFIEPKVTDYTKGCVNKTTGFWTDPWGTQYIIFIDADYASDIAVNSVFTDITTKPEVSVGVASVGYYYVKNKLAQPSMASSGRAFNRNTDLLSWQ